MSWAFYSPRLYQKRRARECHYRTAIMMKCTRRPRMTHPLWQQTVARGAAEAIEERGRPRIEEAGVKVVNICLTCAPPAEMAWSRAAPM